MKTIQEHAREAYARNLPEAPLLAELAELARIAPVTDEASRFRVTEAAQKLREYIERLEQQHA